MHRAKLLAGLLSVLSVTTLQAQPHDLDAAASDPRTMGWMVGFPPPPDRVIGPPTNNFMSFPKLRWTFCHLRELQATRRVARGMGPASPFMEAADHAIDELRFTPIGGGEAMTWRESLDANYTDGILILHGGRIVYEYYSGCLNREGRHGAMSVTKSFVGTIAETLVADGVLDDAAPVTEYVPELAESAFGSATVREVMDMT
ncbi:MAG: serine hydrolase, partial [Pseudomonadota bacterium]